MKGSMLLPALILLGTSCAAAQTKPEAPAAAPSKEKEEKDEAAKKRKTEELQRRIEIAKMKIEIAKTAMKNDEMAGEASLAKARAEKDFAERELKQFTDVDMPRRLEEARLRLQEGRDGLQDAKEELGQLEDMYKDGDLADKTREIVLQRGKRRVERTIKRLELHEIETQSVERFRLPLEREKLSLALKEKVEALAKIEREAAKSKAERIVGVKEAENEVAKIEAELAGLDKGEAKP